jgi:hypothetical protein
METKIILSMSELQNRIHTKDELLDADFEEFGIPCDKSGKSKDNLVVNRRRSILLLNEQLILRELAKRVAKEAAAIANANKRESCKKNSNTEQKKEEKIYNCRSIKLNKSFSPFS